MPSASAERKRPGAEPGCTKWRIGRCWFAAPVLKTDPGKTGAGSIPVSSAQQTGTSEGTRTGRNPVRPGKNDDTGRHSEMCEHTEPTAGEQGLRLTGCKVSGLRLPSHEESGGCQRSPA